MGSWAEGCCISNLEIAPGDKIVVGFIKKTKYDSLNDGAFAQYNFVTPLLRGAYDDYGGCDVEDTDENKTLFLKVMQKLSDPNDEALDADAIDNIRDDLAPHGCALFMARADALDMLRTLRPEFAYDKAVKRIGDGERQTIEKMIAALPKLKKQAWLFRAYDTVDGDEPAEDPLITVTVRTSTGGWEGRPKIVLADGQEIHGHGCTTVAEAESYAKIIEGCHVIYDETPVEIKARKAARGTSAEDMKAYSLRTSVFEHGVRDTPINNTLLLMLYESQDDPEFQALCIRRMAEVDILGWGMGELRKIVAPVFRTGPQYDGWLAVEDFTKYLTRQCAEKRKERAESKRKNAAFMRNYRRVEKEAVAKLGRKAEPKEVVEMMTPEERSI